MSLFEAIVLGIVQGLTEFMPISSSAHLNIVPWAFGWQESPLSFDVALHLGTLVAVLLYFRRDWHYLLKSAWDGILKRDLALNSDGRLVWLILAGTIPAALAGGLGEDAIEGIFHSPRPSAFQILSMAGLLAALGALLWISERRAKQRQDMGALSLGDALIVGVAQAFALLPGVSRSGSTITAGLFLGLKREAAARFSFLLATPIVAGAGLLQMYKLAKEGLPAGERIVFAAGFVAAAVVGYFCIKFLLAFLQRYRTDVFVYYRWVIAAGIVVLFAVRTAG